MYIQWERVSDGGGRGRTPQVISLEYAQLIEPEYQMKFLILHIVE